MKRLIDLHKVNTAHLRTLFSKMATGMMLPCSRAGLCGRASHAHYFWGTGSTDFNPKYYGQNNMNKEPYWSSLPLLSGQYSDVMPPPPPVMIVTFGKSKRKLFVKRTTIT